MISEQRKGIAHHANNEYVRFTVIVGISKVRSHASYGFSAFVVSHTGREGYLAEGSIALVVEEKIAVRVVRAENIYKSVVVVIGESNSHPLPDLFANAGTLSDVV